MAFTTETVIILSGTTWRVPNTWNSINNIVTCIGGGAGGRANGAGSGGGGGGGARAISNNVVLTPNSTITIAIGAGGGANTDGGNTSFNNGVVFAEGGKTGGNPTGGSGGSIAASVGNIKYRGGNGSDGNTITKISGSGGGAAGNTANGGDANTTHGGAGGATGGADASPIAGRNGVQLGQNTAAQGENFAGSGSKGGATDAYGATAAYSPGGLFGGGGGGGNGAGSGSQGVITVQWTYQSILPNTGQIAMSDVAISLEKNPFDQLDLDNANVRSSFQKSSGQIALSDGYTKNTAITFISSNSSSGIAANTLNLPAGTQAGDLALLFIVDATASPGLVPYVKSYAGSEPLTNMGWQELPNTIAKYPAFAYNTQAFWKILQPNESSVTFQQANGGAVVLIYRYASAAYGLQTVDAGAANTLCTFAGITKKLESRKLVSFVADRDPASNPTVPTGWDAHTRTVLTYFAIESASIDSYKYTNGTSIQWTAFSGFYGKMGVLIELT